MFINMNLGGVSEPKPVPNGRYRLTIAEAEFKPEKNYVQVSIGIDGHVEAPNLRHWISFPKEGDEAGTIQYKKLMMKRFLVQFQIPYNEDGFNVEDLPGATAEGNLSVDIPDESKPSVQYNRLDLDKLSD